MGGEAMSKLIVTGRPGFFRSPSLPLTTRAQSLFVDCTLPRCVTSVINDDSCVWAWDIEDERIDDYAKIVKAFLEWIPAASAAQQISAVEALLDKSSIALVWRCAFTAGASQPSALGLYLWPFISQSAFVFSMDTRQSAITLIGAIYPHLSTHDREKFGWCLRLTYRVDMAYLFIIANNSSR